MPKRTDTLSMSREALIAIVAKLVLAVTGFAGVVIFARVLGVDGIGKYYALLAAANLAAQIPSGFNGAIKKRVSEIDTLVSEYFGLGVLFNAGFSLLLTVAVVVAYPLLEEYLGPLVFGLGMVAVTASLGFFALANRMYSGTGHPGASFWTDTIRSVLTLGGQVALLAMGWSVLGLLIGFVAGTVVTTVLVYLVVRIRPTIPSRKTVLRTYEFARWNIPNGLLQNMYSRLDVLLLYVIVGSTSVGLYEPALRLTIPATFITASIGDTLMIKASGLDSIDQDVLFDLRNAISYTSLLALPIFFGALAMPTELMAVIYGPEFADGAWALVGLALFQVFNTFCGPFADVVNGIDRPDVQFRVKFIILLVHAPLAVLLGLEYGLLGVIAATIFSEVVRTGLYLFAGYSLFGELLVTRPVAEQLVSGVIMFAVVSGVVDLVSISGWTILVVVVGIGAAAYFAVLATISSHFRGTLGHVLNEVVIGEIQSRRS